MPRINRRRDYRERRAAGEPNPLEPGKPYEYTPDPCGCLWGTLSDSSVTRVRRGDAGVCFPTLC